MNEEMMNHMNQIEYYDKRKKMSERYFELNHNTGDNDDSQSKEMNGIDGIQEMKTFCEMIQKNIQTIEDKFDESNKRIDEAMSKDNNFEIFITVRLLF